VKQPVFVVDIAMAIFNAIHDDTTIGQTYELAGSVFYSLNCRTLLAPLSTFVDC
jgi:hypothetical protein